MKTTLDLSDALFLQAKTLAQQQGVTLRALVEDGLRKVLQERSAKPKTFKLRDASFGGKKHLQLDFSGLREVANER